MKKIEKVILTQTTHMTESENEVFLYQECHNDKAIVF